jgi:hypothetical protein
LPVALDARGGIGQPQRGYRFAPPRARIQFACPLRDGPKSHQEAAEFKSYPSVDGPAG